MPRHGSVFTHGWCRHLFAQHPSLLQANVTQPAAQNAPAALLNTVELGLSVWAQERDAKIATCFLACKEIILLNVRLSFFFPEQARDERL